MKDKPCEINLVEAGNQTEKIASMLGGYLDACNISASSAAQYVESGDMRVLCSFSSKADPYYPEFLPAAELGYPSAVFESDFWIHGPAGMDPALVEAINLAFKDMETDQTMKEALALQTSEYIWRDQAESLENYKALCQSLIETAESLGMN